MKRIFFFLIFLPAIATAQTGNTVSLVKEILFADSLQYKNQADEEITFLNSKLSLVPDSLHSALANYNLAICYIAKKDIRQAFFFLNRSLRLSVFFHNLILTDSDFRSLYNTPYWEKITASVDSAQLAANPSISRKQLSTELYHIFLKDQQARGLGIKHRDAIHNYDAENLNRVQEIIAQYGWPTFSMVGRIAATGAFLVIQHADVNVQEKYYPQITAAVLKNEGDKESFALLTDRISVYKNGFQVYGTQVFKARDKVTGVLGPYQYVPIKDKDHVDEKRKELGLVPLKEYYNRFGIKYP